MVYIIIFIHRLSHKKKEEEKSIQKKNVSCIFHSDKYVINMDPNMNFYPSLNMISILSFSVFFFCQFYFYLFICMKTERWYDDFTKVRYRFGNKIDCSNLLSYREKQSIKWISSILLQLKYNRSVELHHHIWAKFILLLITNIHWIINNVILIYLVLTLDWGRK